MINYNIISTGSKGNAVVIENEILIDCGVPFCRLSRVYKDLKIVLLSHAHLDHFLPTTIKLLHQNRPTLRFICGEHLYKPLIDIVGKNVVDVVALNKMYTIGSNYKICAVPLAHNVPNIGYKICVGLQKMFYATDTNSLEHIAAKNYDLYLIEGNYGEQEILERIQAKISNGEYSYEMQVINNHLSVEKAEKWLAENMNEKSVWELIHRHSEVTNENFF